MHLQAFFNIKAYSQNIKNESYTLYTLPLYAELLQDQVFLLDLENAILALENYTELNKKGRFTLNIKGNYYLIFANHEKKWVILTSQNSNFEQTMLIQNQLIYPESIKEEIQLLNEFHVIPEILLLYPKKENLHKIELTEDTQKHFLNIKAQLQNHILNYHYTIIERLLNFSLGLVCDYETLRLKLLKLIATVPSITHDKSGTILHQAFTETANAILASKEKLPWYIKPSFTFTKALSKILPKSTFKSLTEASISFAAKRFLGSENKTQTKKLLQHLHRTQRACTLDQLGELVTNQLEADDYCNKVVELILAKDLFTYSKTENRANLPYHHISIKTSALTPHFLEDSDAFTYVYASIEQRLKKIFQTAKQANTFLNFDAEHYGYRDLTVKLVFHFLEQHAEFNHFKNFGFVVQAYLKDSNNHYQQLKKLTQQRGHRIAIRLVKGAYWDNETIEATAKNYPSPQFLNKIETDIQYRQLMHKLLEDHEYFQLCLASHNVDDHCYAETIREFMYPKAPTIEHQTLHMTYEPLSVACTKMNWAIRNYLPVGSLLMGMGYLVRRIMENASQTGVLTAIRHHQTTPTNISLTENLFKLIHMKQNHSEMANQPKMQFIQTPTTRLFSQADAETFKKALHNTTNFLFTDKRETSVSIFSKFKDNHLIGQYVPFTETQTKEAVQKAKTAFASWCATSSQERAQCLKKTALLLKIQKYELACLIMQEAGKTRTEALADVEEAVDFLNFYAQEVLKLDYNIYEPIGPFAIIAPWNFPIAILCGMASAALVSGNSIILKPAEQTPLIAIKFHQCLLQAGVPAEVAQIANGRGEIVGSTLVNHNEIKGIAFTGSKAVGTWIYQKSLKIKAENIPFHRKVITEMGGKNTLIICEDAELDLAITASIYSAFGHAGQKCSACSRILIHESIFKIFAERFIMRAQEIIVATPEFAETFINPLISKEEAKKTLKNVALMKELANQYSETILLDLSKQDNPESIGPVIVHANQRSLQDPTHLLYQELFAPLIYLITYTSLEDSVNIFNNTNYALTGGVFTQSDERIQYYIKNLNAGNLYFNRNITGARVGIEPFGGFKLSGTGPKAGGYDYLPAFVQTKKSKVSPLAHLTIVNDYKQTNDKTKNLNLWAKIAWGGKLYLAEDFTAISEDLYKIPGQKNYIDYSFKKRNVLFIIEQENLSESCLKLLSLAEHFSMKYRIACFHQETEAFLKSSPFAQKTQKINLDDLNNESQEKPLELILYSLTAEAESQILKHFSNPKFYQNTMLQIINTNDLAHQTTLQSLARLLSEARCITINTMRYGAPLDE